MTDVVDVDADGGAHWVPSSCSLPTAAQPLRVAEFDQLFSVAAQKVVTVSETTVDVLLDSGQDTALWARDLTAKETACCQFFRFELTERAAEPTILRIQVPSERTDVLQALAARAASLIRRPGG